MPILQSALFKKLMNHLIDFFNKKSILIVDDDHMSALLLRENLKFLNTTLLVAYNTHDAIEIFKSNPDIALVLLDLKFHTGCGYEVAKQMRELSPKVIIIAQTAMAIDEERIKLKHSCFDGYIFKPILSDLLLKTISNLIP